MQLIWKCFGSTNVFVMPIKRIKTEWWTDRDISRKCSGDTDVWLLVMPIKHIKLNWETVRQTVKERERERFVSANPSQVCMSWETRLTIRLSPSPSRRHHELHRWRCGDRPGHPQPHHPDRQLCHPPPRLPHLLHPLWLPGQGPHQRVRTRPRAQCQPHSYPAGGHAEFDRQCQVGPEQDGDHLRTSGRREKEYFGLTCWKK